MPNENLINSAEKWLRSYEALEEAHKEFPPKFDMQVELSPHMLIYSGIGVLFLGKTVASGASLMLRHVDEEWRRRTFERNASAVGYPVCDEDTVSDLFRLAAFVTAPDETPDREKLL